MGRDYKDPEVKKASEFFKISHRSEFASSKRKIMAHPYLFRGDFFNQHLFHELPGMPPRKLLCKARKHAVPYSKGTEEFQFIFKAYDKGRAFPRRHHLQGVGFECVYNRRKGEFFCPLKDLFKNFLMPQMESVEVPERKHRILYLF